MPPPPARREPSHPADLDASALAEARLTLAAGEPVRIAVGRTVVLCSSEQEVREALAGRIPRSVKRLDAAR
jgi:hypothetical protein